METLGDRLRRAREAAGLTQAELAERVGMRGQQSIAAIESGKSKNPTRIYEIAKACNTTVEWLQGRPEGAALKSRQSLTKGQLAREFGGRPPADLDAQRESARATLRELADISGSTTWITERTEEGTVDLFLDNPPFAIKEIDLKGGASYGGGKTDEEWQNGDVSADKAVAIWQFPSNFAQRELGLRAERVEILQVRGDSMEDGSVQALKSGDRVIIDRLDADPRQGGIFAVWDGDGVIIKQVELLRGFEPPRIVCKSLNTRYDPIELVLEDGLAHIIGRVAGVIQRR